MIENVHDRHWSLHPDCWVDRRARAGKDGDKTNDHLITVLLGGHVPVLCLDILENKVADRISDRDKEGVGG